MLFQKLDIYLIELWILIVDRWRSNPTHSKACNHTLTNIHTQIHTYTTHMLTHLHCISHNKWPTCTDRSIQVVATKIIITVDVFQFLISGILIQLLKIKCVRIQEEIRTFPLKEYYNKKLIAQPYTYTNIHINKHTHIWWQESITCMYVCIVCLFF